MSRSPHVLPVRPTSLTHQHIYAVLNTHLIRERWIDGSRVRGEQRPLRILDIGCGDGLLVGFLQSMFAHDYPDTFVEIYGFDVGEFGFQDAGQLPEACDMLAAAHPQIDWSRRIELRSASESWGYDRGFFDLAVSNQVLEHVSDLDHFLTNLKHALRTDGISVHLFPMAHHVVEGHTNMPLLHWVKDHQSRIALATWLNRIGLSRYDRDREILGYDDPHAHAIDAAKFVQGFTCYRTFSQIHRQCNEQGLAVSRQFTKDFYLAKLRQVLRLAPVTHYRPWNWLLAESLLASALQYVAAVTLSISPIDYDVGERIRREKEHRARRRQQTEVAA